MHAGGASGGGGGGGGPGHREGMTRAPGDAQIWDQAETLPPPQLQALQLDRLRATVKRILDGQPFAAQRLTAAGLDAPEQLTSLGDLARLPFTSKADLRARYPFGLLAVGRDQLVRVHASSGTHGKPTVVGYTRADLENWTELMARCMTMAGVRPGMTLHNANGYGLFTGGLGFHQGGERIGATVVPVSGGFTARQLLLLHDLGARVLISTPSYALAIAQAIAEAGVTGLNLELGLLGGEPWTEAMREQIERALGITAVNFYGLSEMCGPGVAAECPARAGLHVQEDHFAVEVIDRSDGQAATRRRRGARLHHADQGSHAAAAVPDRRHRPAGHRDLRMRAHHGPGDRAARPSRRHADRARSQHLPVAGRARTAQRRRRGPALPPDRGASRPAGRADARV